MKAWLKGLLSVGINAAVGGASAFIYQWGTQTAQTGAAAPISGATVGYIALGSGVIGLINYLVKSPIPVDSEK